MRKFFILSLIFISINIYSQDKNFINLDQSLDSIVIADKAVIEVSIQSHHSTEDSTLNEQNRKVLSVLSTLNLAGYNKESIYNRSSNFSSGINEKEELVYYAFQSYRFLLSDFESYDKLKTALIKAGATGLKIVRFWKSNYDEIRNSLYQKVLGKADQKAKLFSNSIGAESYEIKGITDKTNQVKLDDFLLFEDKNRFLAHGVVIQEAELSMTSTKIKISVNLYVVFTFDY